MTKDASLARKNRLTATQRLIDSVPSEEVKQTQPKQQHRAKRRYMVEPLEVEVRVAHA
jgi:hypothetical protein